MLHNQAEAYRSQGQYDKAEPLYLRALSIWERILESEHLEVAASQNKAMQNLYNSKKAAPRAKN